MSAAPAFAPSVDTPPGTPLRAGAPAGPRPTPVDLSPRVRRAARPRIRYAIVAVAGIFAILLGQLFLSMVVSEGAYEIQALQSANKQLSRDVQRLTEAQRNYSSTQYLVANAAALGMVNDPNRVFLRLSDGAVLGTPVPARADNAAVTSSDLVPNSLAEKLPLAVAAAGGAAEPKKVGDQAVPGAPVSPSADAPVASTVDGLPSPVTR